ncbi:MAG: hypothetical protein ABH878_07130, partial [bacterium]
MEVRDSNAQLLYGFFQSICTWALENGYSDISTMKNLLKLAMVDVCRKQYDQNSAVSTQMALVTDLGISLRNVQYSLRALEKLQNLTGSFVKIRKLQREILIYLNQKPHTVDEILSEVSYLIHAPYDLQKRTLNAILRDLLQKSVIREEKRAGKIVYHTAQNHVALYDPSDLSARLMALLGHIDAFKHSVRQPYFKTFWLTATQARELHARIQEQLIAIGERHEEQCSREGEKTKTWYFYLGSVPVSEKALPENVAEVLLEVIHTRFCNVESPALARTHWYHLTPEAASVVFEETCQFFDDTIHEANDQADREQLLPFSFY